MNENILQVPQQDFIDERAAYRYSVYAHKLGFILAVCLAHHPEVQPDNGFIRSSGKLGIIRAFFGNEFAKALSGSRLSSRRCNKSYLQGLDKTADIGNRPNRPIVGETDLATRCPDLLLEWDFEKNSPQSPENYTCGSNQKVWWKCFKEGHSWKAVIFDRYGGCGCPYCAGKLAVSGKNDTATLFPALVSEWDSERNAKLTLSQLLPNSSKKVWWICKRGHHWKTSVQARTHGSKCPYCMGKTPMRPRLVK